MQKIYRMRDTAPGDVHAALSEHPELLRELFFTRGITDRESAARFLSPSFERGSHDPFLLPGMDVAVERIRRAAHAGELVCVWSDYDCDGIPGGVALTEFLRDIGCRVRHYIPHRHEEGYGLNEKGLREVAAEGIRLVITVDLGVSEVKNVELASSLGMETIITDHHLPPQVLPEALALLNPHRKDSAYPFRELCGAGVAWKLIQGVLARERFGIPPGREKWLLDLIGLATLSDMVPLVGENRMLASYGLLVMRKTRRPGIREMLKLLRINMRTLNEDDITFMLSPRINAASRMERPETAARMLATADAEEGAELARALNRINDERKGAVASIVKEARHRLAARAGTEAGKIIVLGSPKWRPGVLGLVANSLMEAEGRPVFLWGREGGELLKGSCRSNDVSVVELMRAAGDTLEGFGGHEFSGGFSLREDRVHELAGKLSPAYALLRAEMGTEKEIFLDGKLALDDAPRALAHLARLSPYGEGNRKPLFLFPNVSVSRLRMFGKTENHLELILAGAGATISGVSFFSTPDSFTKSPREGVRADIVANVEPDFRGRPRLRVVDVL